MFSNVRKFSVFEWSKYTVILDSNHLDNDSKTEEKKTSTIDPDGLYQNWMKQVIELAQICHYYCYKSTFSMKMVEIDRKTTAER